MREKISNKAICLSWISKDDEVHQKHFRNFKSLHLWLKDQEIDLLSNSKFKKMTIQQVDIVNCFKN